MSRIRNPFATAGVMAPMLMALCGLLLVLGACGGGDDPPEQHAAAQRSLVPANLDTLIAETGSDHPEAFALDSVPPAGSELPASPVAETPAEETPPVEFQHTPPPAVPADRSPSVAPRGTGSYSVQLGSFSVRSNAVALVAKLEDLGQPASIEQALVRGSTYHRVFVRGLDSQSEAEILGEELSQALGISYLVLRSK